jgi:hypothetical protein
MCCYCYDYIIIMLGRASSTNGERVRNFGWRLEGRRQFGKSRRRWQHNMKWFFRGEFGMCGLKFIWLMTGTVNFCEHGNKLSDSIKSWNFLTVQTIISSSLRTLFHSGKNHYVSPSNNFASTATDVICRKFDNFSKVWTWCNLAPVLREL